MLKVFDKQHPIIQQGLDLSLRNSYTHFSLVLCCKGKAYLAKTLRTSYTIISEFIDRHPYKRA